MAAAGSGGSWPRPRNGSTQDLGSTLHSWPRLGERARARRSKGIISVALNEEEPAFVGGAREVRERQTRGKGKAAVWPSCPNAS